MKRVKLLSVSLVLMAAGTAYAFDDGDFQVWHTENQEFKVNKESKLTLEEEFRFGDDASDFFYQHYDAGFVYTLNKNLDLGINYRQVYEKKKGEFEAENRPYVNAVLKFDLRGFKLDDRNRFEYRHFDYQGDDWRYRNKVTLKFPWKFTKLDIQPYLSDEVFVDLNKGILNRNRFYSGFGFNLTKNLKADIYYLLQSSKGLGGWTDANVFGTKLKISF